MAQVIVVGGGAAGMLAAVCAAESGASVTVLERNARVGRKLMITGKGRCNVTNACDVRTFLTHVTSDPRFLHSALAAFSPEDAMQFFTQRGLALKVERGRRVFPVSDRASDVVDCLHAACRDAGAELLCGRAEAVLVKEGAVCGIVCEDGSRMNADAVILATGGLSYPLTGSTGDGYRMARALGHSVTPLCGSLVAMVSEDAFCPACQGLSLKNVRLTLMRGTKCLYSDQGEMLFTHFGLSGPLVLSASARMEEKDACRAVIDLKPALDDQRLDDRILREIAENPRRELRGLMRTLLPGKMLEPFLLRLHVDPQKRSAEISREERAALVRALHSLTLPVCGLRPVEEAIVTRGGVSTREISPKTMESKLVKGLFFAGELMDVSAETGGYNLQIAFSTGFAAGRAAANITK